VCSAEQFSIKHLDSVIYSIHKQSGEIEIARDQVLHC